MSNKLKYYGYFKEVTPTGYVPNDNVISFKSGATQTIWFWLDDDEIYLNDKVQALTPCAYDEEGHLYNEITYNGFQCDIYLPEGIFLQIEF